MGQRRHLERVRRHFALALTEAELELHLALEGEYGPSSSRTAEGFADRCGILAYCLGEVCERIGRTTEAKVHFQRGVGYYNVHSALKLSLYAKLDGCLDDALYLLTSASEETDPDVDYLLGDHFCARTDFDRARVYFESAAALGQERAAARLMELGTTEPDSVDSGVEEYVELGFGWAATIDHVEGGGYVTFEDYDVEFLGGNSLLTFIDHGTVAHREARSSELEAHRVAVDDLKRRSVTFKDASRTGLVQVRCRNIRGQARSPRWSTTPRAKCGSTCSTIYLQHCGNSLSPRRASLARQCDDTAFACRTCSSPTERWPHGRLIASVRFCSPVPPPPRTPPSPPPAATATTRSHRPHRPRPRSPTPPVRRSPSRLPRAASTPPAP